MGSDSARPELPRISYHHALSILHVRLVVAFLHRLAGHVTGFLWRNRRWGTYSLTALVLLFIGLALVSFSVAFTEKDLGIRVVPDGTVTGVENGSLAQQTGAVVGATTGPRGFSEINLLNDTMRIGETADVTLFLDTGTAGTRSVQIRVIAQELPLDQKLVVVIGSMTAMLYMVLGLILLQMRKQNFVTYLQFVCFEAAGLMLVASQSRAYASWAGIGWAFVMPLCFGAFAHLHMYFPASRLGKSRDKATVALYGVTAFVVTFNLSQIALQAGGTLVYMSPLYEIVVFMFIAGCLLLSTSLLICTAVENRTVRDRLVGRRLGTLRFAATSFLLIIVTPIVALLTHFDMNEEAQLCSYFGGWILALGYTRAMFQGEAKLQASLVARKRVIIAIGAALLLLLWLGIAVNLKTALSQEWLPAGGQVLNNNALILWGVLCVSALLFGGLIVSWSNWAEARLFQGGRDVAFVNECSVQLAGYTTKEELTHFFTDMLPVRLKTKGNVVLLPDQAGHAGNMVLQGYTRALRDHVSKNLITTPALVGIDEELRNYLEDAGHQQPLVLSKLPRNYPEPDLFFVSEGTAGLENNEIKGETSKVIDAPSCTLLTILDGIRAEVLLPLRAGGQLAGLVAMRGKDDDEPYSDQELGTLAAVGRYAAISIENIQLIETLHRQLHVLISEKERTALLAQEVYKASSRERAHLSREIHDTALQDLTLVSRFLYMVRDDLATLVSEISHLEVQSVSASDDREVRSPSASSAGASTVLLRDHWLETLLGEFGASPRSDVVPGAESSMSYLKMAIDSVYRVNEQLRAICTNLRPGYLNFSMRRLMELDVEEAKAGCSIPIELRISGTEPDTLPDNLKDAIHKVAKIGLSNAVHHCGAGASRIELILEISRENIKLTISDDGCGFILAGLSEYQATNRFGLVNMHDHAFMVGGDITIVTAQGEGTTVRLVVPVDPGLAME